LHENNREVVELERCSGLLSRGRMGAFEFAVFATATSKFFLAADSQFKGSDFC
jgi:hypothetical protein